VSPDISRRDFLKTASAAAAAGVTVSPVSSLSAQNNRQEKSRVVKAYDEGSMSGSTAVASRIQDMVDYAIMHLTGIADKGKAYEALFPEPVTDKTIIAVKKNGNGSRSPSYAKVLDALKKGLTSMLYGSFPASNVRIVTSRDSAGPTNPSFEIAGRTYTIKDNWVNADWIINAPICWAHNRPGHGVTMALKNMMGCVSGTLEYLHDYGNDEQYPWMSILNSQPTFKDKLVLVVLDAICGRAEYGPGGSPDFNAFCILATQDPVANDYIGTGILLDNGLKTQWSEWGYKAFELAAKSPYNLGNNTDDTIDLVEIEYPFDDPTPVQGKSEQQLKEYVQVSVTPAGSQVTFSYPNLEGKQVDLSIYSLHGKKIWSSKGFAQKRMVWNGMDSSGNRVHAGIYAYSLNVGGQVINGKVQIKQ